jgi:gliding motility-associated-like protein
LKKHILIFLLIIAGLKAFPAVFVVTSNADSGPGTLREALTLAAANGSVVKDSISFNLADTSQAGRTIILVSVLPDLSSNLVIDGTTQSGSAFGLSNAKVKISTPQNNITFIIFNGDGLNDVKLFGLYIHDYADINTLRPDLKLRTGINIKNSTKVVLGGINKGNLIKGFNYHAAYFENVDNLTIQNNIIGLTEKNTFEDAPYDFISLTADVSIISCNDISIGGDTGLGNILFCYFNIGFAQKSANNKLLIKLNNFGVFQNGTTSWEYQDMNFVNIYTIGLNYDGISSQDKSKSAGGDFNIEDNLAGDFGNVFIINAIKGVVNFYGNYLGIAKDGLTGLNNQKSHPGDGVPIRISGCDAQINIGSDDISQKNFFGYCDLAVTAQNVPNLFLRNNEYQCISIKAYSNGNYYQNDILNKYNLPVVALTEVNSANAQTTLKGTSTALATVDIYSSESCMYKQCSIRKYIQSVTADNTGNWQSNILNLSGIFYISATVNNQTSEFKTFEVNSSNAVVNSLRCGKIASITGLQVPKGLSYYWIDQNGNIVSNDLDLQTSKPGTYQLILGNGCVTSSLFQIDDNRVRIYDYSLTTINISCGVSNGAIKNLYVYDPENKVKATLWFNSAGKVIGNKTNIDSLAAGMYYFKVFTTDSCEVDYGPVILKNVSGPNIDQSNISIQSTNCGQSFGSITNLNVTGTGTLKYVWLNSQQQTVGTTKDIVNQPGGIYKLQVTDDTQCGPIYSTNIEIPETNGIVLDESATRTKVASCSSNNGSITGLKITGATQYQWADAANKLVGITADLQNVAAGDYTLTVSNTFGCSKTSKTYHIGLQPPTQYPAYTATILNSCFGANNGGVAVTTDALVTSVRWVNGQGNTIGNTSVIANIPAGAYQLYLTDQTGCESLYKSYNVSTIAQLQIVAGSEQISNDQCGLKTGSLTNIQIAGGMQPYTYSWLDANNNIVSSSINLSGISGGSYTLQVNDASKCNMASAVYVVQSQNDIILPPEVRNVQLCSPGDALLQVSNPSTVYAYRLYDSETSAMPLDQQPTGAFKITVKTNRDFYISRVSGDCESERTAVHVSVGLTSLDIANTFTPNGDGVNDYWKITGIGSYPDAVIQVFTRYGGKLFESKGYIKPFDGTSNGKQLPIGVYYYIINLSTNCSLLTGSLTIIR